MLKFMKNDNKKKSLENDKNDDVCSLEAAEKFVIDNDSTFIYTNNIKLHRNLLKILNDKTILSFFIQYLESKNGLPLVKFWLDVETFKAVGETTSSLSNSERNESRISNYDSVKSDGVDNRTQNFDGCDTLRDYDCASLSTTTSEETEEVQPNDSDEVDHVRTNEIDVTLQQMSLTDDEKFKICEKNRKNEECNAKSVLIQDKKFQPMIFEDALRIYRKYLVTDSTYSIELPAEILGKLSLALCVNNDSESDTELNNLLQAFEEAQKFIFEAMERDFLQDFLDSSFYCKYTIDVMTSESLQLTEILCSETALFYFMEFLEQEENKENSKLSYLEFWLSATNFRKQLDQSNIQLSSDQLRQDALVIYEKWISLQATSPLMFSNRMRTKIEEQICTDSFDALLKCFDESIKIVEIFLERNCFKKFMKSQLFFKHLSEIVSKIDSGSESLLNENKTSGIIRKNSSFGLKFSTIRHRRANSETFEKKGTTRSISAQNTLLAGLDHKRNKNSTDLHIDSRLLIDPDMLWRRQNATAKLSFGRVDEYGRFERDFEMPTSANIPQSRSFQLLNDSIDIDDPQSIFEQTKWSSTQNRIKNAMRKLVHLPEDSLQQEIAWQMAELIVKDVTSITLQNENRNS